MSSPTPKTDRALVEIAKANVARVESRLVGARAVLADVVDSGPWWRDGSGQQACLEHLFGQRVERWERRLGQARDRLVSLKSRVV